MDLAAIGSALARFGLPALGAALPLPGSARKTELLAQSGPPALQALAPRAGPWRPRGGLRPASGWPGTPPAPAGALAPHLKLSQAPPSAPGHRAAPGPAVN